MLVDNQRLFDGVTSWAGGQDAGRNPVLIGEDQYQFGENVHCRGGTIGTRTAYRLRTLSFTNNITYDDQGGHGGNNPVGSQAAFTNGLFQAASFYDPSLNIDCIMASVGGRLFQIVPRRTSVDITELYLDKQNRGNIQKAYMVQADRFHVTQDGESTPILFDGVSARRAGVNEIFTGTIMAYGMGRIVLVGKNLRDIYFGDLYGSHEGEPGASVLQFTETNFLSEGGAASLPFTMGHCKGLAFVPEQDTSMGQGQLFAFAEKGAASFFLSLERSQWKQSQFQVMALIDVGATGDRSITPVNGDIWFRSKDGWRTYRQARAEARGWFQLPLSTEVGNYVDVETPSIIDTESSINFQNRLWTLCTPIWNQGKPYYNGMLSLDFDVLSSFGQTAHKPAWDGHHSGIKALQLVTGSFDGQERAFCFGLDDGGLNCIYELDPSATKDSSGPITSSVVPRSFTFQQYFNEDTLFDADVWFEDVRENTTFSAYFKPDSYPNWLPWRTGSKYPPTTLTPIGVAGQLVNGLPTLREGFTPRRSLGKPDVDYDTSNTKRGLKLGYEFHVKLEWTGFTAINRFRVMCERLIEKAKAQFN
jgi:hypothetical protein